MKENGIELVIDMEKWERKEIFKLYSMYSCPFYMITYKLDVTNLYRFVKQKKLSFYLSLIYLCTKAANSILNFRYAIREGKVVLLNRRDIVFCDLTPGDEIFHITCVDFEGDIEEFCKRASQKSRSQKKFIEENPGDYRIAFSCVPWLEMTALTNEHELRKEHCEDEATPMISWDKYTEQNGQKILRISLDINHRFIDGIHIARFSEGLQNLINSL